MRTKVRLSEIEDHKNNYEPTKKLRRSGFVVISQLKTEFSKIDPNEVFPDAYSRLTKVYEKLDFSTKFENDLEAFKIEFPGATKSKFIEDETTRLNNIKTYLQECLSDYYSDFQEYQTVNSYLEFIQEPDRNQEPGNQKPKEITPFGDYLQNCDKVKLMKMLHELLDNAKSKDFARFLIALKELSYIHIPKPRNELYKSLRVEFKNIGTDAAMNYYFFDNEGDKNKINSLEIEETKQLIEKGLKG